MGSELTRFRDVLEYAIGGGWGKETPDAKHAVAVTVVRGTDFSKLRGGDLNEVPRRYEVGSKVTKRTLEVGDIILEVSGGSPARGQTTGRTCYIDDVVLETLHQPIIPASFCRLVRVDRSKVVPRFAYYWLQDMYQSGRAAAYENQSTGISNFQFERFLDAEAIVLPDLSIQQHVVETLVSIDDRIDNLRQTNATLEAIAQALFKSWFADFDPVRAKAEGREPEGMDAATAALFPSEFEDSELGPVPKGWQVMPLLDACDLQGGSQPPASTFINEPRDGYVRLLQIRDFSTDAHPTYIPVSKKLKTAQEDDILIGRYGSASGDKQKDSLGRICRGLEGAYNVALMKLSPAAVGREFALQLFNDQNFYNYLQGVSTKAVQSGFSKKELALYKVVVPSSNLLAHYESLGVAVWQRVKMARQQIAALTALRDTLLPRLISGKLRLPEAEREIEAATA